MQGLLEFNGFAFNLFRSVARTGRGRVKKEKGVVEFVLAYWTDWQNGFAVCFVEDFCKA
jgi:hypothetical protein